MSEVSVKISDVLQELGFEVVYQDSRVIRATQRTEDGGSFFIYVDQQCQTISLNCNAGPISQYIIKQQGFSDANDLKSTLLKNKVFTQYRQGSG